MIWGRLGPVFILILVFVMGSSICLAAHRPSSSRRRLAVSRHRERLAGPGRGGRKPQQTRHGAWRSHGSPARKGVLRPAPLARWGATSPPTRCPSQLLRPLRCSHYPLPQPTVFPCSTSTALTHPPCSHSPIPLMCLFLCPIPTVHTALSPPTASFLLPQHVAPPTASTSTAQSHALLRNYWLSLLRLTAARTASTPLTRPTAPPTLPSPTPR